METVHEEEVERKQRQHQQQHKFEVQEGNDRGNEPGEGAMYKLGLLLLPTHPRSPPIKKKLEGKLVKFEF